MSVYYGSSGEFRTRVNESLYFLPVILFLFSDKLNFLSGVQSSCNQTSRMAVAGQTINDRYRFSCLTHEVGNFHSLIAF
jgi:hypothetical protein